MSEIRDSIYDFIDLSTKEKKFLNLPLIQRLKHISQLGLTFYLYPGARHSRFEHSIGTMHIATKIFDHIFNQEFLADLVKKTEINNEQCKKLITEEGKAYYRNLLRFAAICHDIGHLPFSHATEKVIEDKDDLSFSHEWLTYYLILTDEISEFLINDEHGEKIERTDIERISKIALGNTSLRNLGIPEIKDDDCIDRILSDIITGELGSDRIDYLLRDSHFCGVDYGNFDYHKLIQSMKIGFYNNKLLFGVDPNGIHCVESLIMGRYYMSAQVYRHKTRISYDLTLKDYVKSIINSTSTDVNLHFKFTKEAITNIQSAFSNKTTKLDPKKICKLTDYAFLDHFSETGDSGKRFLERNPYSFVFSNTPFTEEIHIYQNLKNTEGNNDDFIFESPNFNNLPNLNNIYFILGDEKLIRKNIGLKCLESTIPKNIEFIFNKRNTVSLSQYDYENDPVRNIHAEELDSIDEKKIAMCTEVLTKIFDWILPNDK